jgi:hypothetical protein
MGCLPQPFLATVLLNVLLEEAIRVFHAMVGKCAVHGTDKRQSNQNRNNTSTSLRTQRRLHVNARRAFKKGDEGSSIVTSIVSLITPTSLQGNESVEQRRIPARSVPVSSTRLLLKSGRFQKLRLLWYLMVCRRNRQP